MIERAPTALAICPDELPADIFALRYYVGGEATRQELSALYYNLSTQTKALASGEIVINPAGISTSARSETPAGHSAQSEEAAMCLTFALAIPLPVYDCPDSLSVTIDEIDPRSPDQVESYHYKLDEEGGGYLLLTIRPFELANGVIVYRPNSTTQIGLLSTRDLQRLDNLYANINANLVPRSIVAPANTAKTVVSRGFARLLRLLAYGPAD